MVFGWMGVLMAVIFTRLYARRKMKAVFEQSHRDLHRLATAHRKFSGEPMNLAGSVPRELRYKGKAQRERAHSGNNIVAIELAQSSSQPVSLDKRQGPSSTQELYRSDSEDSADESLYE